MITYSEAQAKMRTARGGTRKLGNNTYLHEVSDGYSVRLHSTGVVTVHADGTYTLRTNGWQTVTTKQRINEWSPAWVYSHRGTWCIWSASDPKTPANVKTCRTCKGTGEVQRDIWGMVSSYRPHRQTVEFTEDAGETYAHSEWSLRYAREFSWRSDPVPLERDGHPVTGQPARIDIVGQWDHVRHHAVTGHEMVTCHNCGGARTYDYGSKQRPVIFEDGIVVNSAGEVVNPDGYDRLYPQPEDIARKAKAEAKAKRAAARAAKNRVRDWIRDHGLTVSADGKTVRMWKSVRDDYRSAHGTTYRPGTTVTAPDYRPYGDCGGGLHFAPTVTGGRDVFDYYATRFLACDVDIASMVPSSGKAKARTCRVAFEVREDGTPVGRDGDGRPYPQRLEDVKS